MIEIPITRKDVVTTNHEQHRDIPEWAKLTVNHEPPSRTYFSMVVVVFVFCSTVIALMLGLLHTVG